MKDGKAKLYLKQLMARLRSKATSDWLSFSEGASEIAKGLGIAHEPASMLLYGLCATGNVRCSNKKLQVLDPDDYMIADFEGEPAYVAASDVRHWLAQWSKAPLANILDTVIAEKLQAGVVPGRIVPASHDERRYAVNKINEK